MGKRIDLVGQTFGKLKVTEFDCMKKGGSFWICSCECGNKKSLRGADLKRNYIKSCGCLRREAASNLNKKHSKTNTREYKIWKGIIRRCTSITSQAYKNYGGRGIDVCERWMEFENFLADMGERPSTNHSIDRIDNNKGYSPKNCRWATGFEQNLNQRISKANTSGHKGVSFDKSVGKWCAYITINRKRINLGRFKNIEDAIEARKSGEAEYWNKTP